MTKSNAIREALANGPLDIDALQAGVEKSLGQAIVRKQLQDLLSALKTQGQVKYNGKGDARTYSLGSSPPPKSTRGKGKKPAGKRKTTTMRDIAIKHTNAGSLTLRHVATTFALLEAVIDLEGADEQVRAAFNAHKEAIEIAGVQS